MNKPIFAILISIAVLTISCKKQETLQIVQLEDVVFHTGFPQNSKCYGSYYDAYHKQELIYFSDPKYCKCLKTYTLSGELKDSIPLGNVFTDTFTIDALNIYARDTILINSYFPNILYMADYKGNVWNTLLPNSLPGRDTTYQYEYWSSMQPNSIIGGKEHIYLHNNANVEFNPVNNDYVEAYKNFYRKSNKVPFLIKIDGLFSEQPFASLEPEDYFHRLYSNANIEDEIFGLPFFYSTDSLVFVFNPCSDKVLYYPHNNPNKLNTFTVKSQYSKIGAPAIELNEETIKTRSDEINKNVQTMGNISRLYFNKNAQVYYVGVTHSIPEGKTREEHYYDRPFSIIFLNKDFEKIAEHDYSYLGYSFGKIIPTDDGFLIGKRNDSIPSKLHDKYTYTRFRLDR